MKKILVIFLLLFSVGFSQTTVKDYYYNSNKQFYIYSPSTDTAINITTYSATLVGDDGKIKSNKTDTLATKKTPYRYLTYYTDTTLIVPDAWEVQTGWTASNDTLYCDGSQEINSSIYMLPPGKGYFLTSDLDSIYYSFELFGYTAGNVSIVLFYSTGNYTQPIIENNGVYSGYLSNFSHKDVRFGFRADADFIGNITDIETYSFFIDSVSGKRVTLNDLQVETEYNYYYSIFVRTNTGDKSIDYYRGETKTFTTLALPEGNYLQTEDLIYVVTEDGYYIQFEGE